MFLLSKKIAHEINIQKTCMENRHLSREFRPNLQKVRYWKCQQNFLLSPKNLSLSSICLHISVFYQYFIYIYIYIYKIYIYILNRCNVGEGEGVVGGSTEIKRMKTRETRPYMLLASLTSYTCQHGSCKGLLPNENRVWNNIIISKIKIKIVNYYINYKVIKL